MRIGTLLALLVSALLAACHPSSAPAPEGQLGAAAAAISAGSAPASSSVAPGVTVEGQPTAAEALTNANTASTAIAAQAASAASR